MMYDELIEQLRETSIDFGESDHVSVMLIEAADAIEDLITALTASNEVIAKNKPKWIPVTERLPGNHEYVLCCGSKGGMFVGWVGSCSYYGEAKAMGFVHGGHGRYLTHWMPLPQPPESEGE